MIERPGGRPEPPPSPEWERICRAIIDLVVDGGYDLTTVEAIVERAGVSRADFDRYFSGLEDCYVQAYWTYVAWAFEEQVFSAFEEHDNWRDGLRAAAYAAARFIRDNPRECRFGSLEMMQIGPVAQAHRERQLHGIVDLIDGGRAEMEDPDSVGRSAAEAALGAIYMTTVKGIGSGNAKRGDDFVPELMYLAVRPYLGEEVAREELSIPAPPEPEG